jgi:hypothetical protein
MSRRYRPPFRLLVRPHLPRNRRVSGHTLSSVPLGTSEEPWSHVDQGSLAAADAE